MANTIDKVLAIANAEVGYLEKSSNSGLYSKRGNAGYNNFTKYGKEMHDIFPAVMDFPAAWCDAFVDWCFYKAYGIANARKMLCGNFDDYTVQSAQLYKNKNRWFNAPQIGDQIFFNNANGRICHTGLVVELTNNYVYTIEGNTSGASGVIANGGGVCKKRYAYTYNRIAGYGRPLYDSSKKAETSPNKISVSKNDVIRRGQMYANEFVDAGLKIDGIRGPKTIKAAVKVLQEAMNLDYKAGLVVDGEFGSKSNKALGNHYVQEGEMQYMVTALEILLMLKGYDTNGVEKPGIFGSGCKKALISYCGKSKATSDVFKTLIR